MNPVRFVVAKYIADRRRMEPKNIGVIAWHDGTVCGRFAGEVNGAIKPPRLVDRDARKAYLRVVESWRLQFDKPSIPIGRGRDDVPRSSPDFLQAIARYSQENFVIVEGGHISESTVGATLPSVVDNLFTEMVDDSSGHDGRHKSALIRACETLFAPLKNNAKFHPDFAPPNTALPFTFSYGFGDKDNPSLLLQVVSLHSPDQVASAAMKFRCASDDEHLVDPSHCACLIDGRGDGRETRNRISFLSRYSQIVNVADVNIASAQLSRMGLPLLTA